MLKEIQEEVAFVTFRSQTKRLIDIPTTRPDLIRIYTQQGLEVVTRDVVDTERSELQVEIIPEKSVFDFYPHYDTLITLLEKTEPSGVQDVEELQILVEDLPGYEVMDESDCVDCFQYMNRRKEYLNGSNN